MTAERRISLTEAFYDLATLPLRLAAAPLVAVAPPEAQEHLRAAYRETRAAARSLLPRSVLRRSRRVETKIIVE